MTRCVAMTKAGKQCTKPALKNTKYCNVHKKTIKWVCEGAICHLIKNK